MNSHMALRATKVRPLAVFASLLALVTVVNALLVGCSSKSETPEANPPAANATSTPPAGATAGGDLGSQIYTERCVLCHGASGKGDGAAAAALNPKPRNHTDGSYMNSRTDEDLLTVIRGGKGNMPAWGTVLSEEQIQAVLKHVRSLAEPPYQGTH